MVDPIFSPPNSPGTPDPPKPDWAKLGAVAGILAVVIALANWLLPVQAFLESPFKPDKPTPEVEEPAPAQPPVVGEDTSVPIDEVPPVPSDEPGLVSETSEIGADPDMAENLPWSGEPEPAEEVASAEPPPSGQDSSRRRPVIWSWLERTFGSGSGEEPVVPEVEQPPNPGTPGPSVHPVDQQETRETDVDEEQLPHDRFEAKIDVNADYEDPTGPRMVGELTLPQLPTEALRSRAPGKRFIVRVRVSADGRATVTRMDGSWLPPLVQERIREHLERRPWIPKTDSAGVTRESDAAVIFRWE